MNTNTNDKENMHAWESKKKTKKCTKNLQPLMGKQEILRAFLTVEGLGLGHSAVTSVINII